MDGVGKILISTFESDSFIWIMITDTGTGISTEDHKKIFDPFYTTKEVGKGTGLGLFVVHQIIKRYHGLIEIEGQIGKGTIVSIKLPININT